LGVWQAEFPLNLLRSAGNKYESKEKKNQNF
jgi:hypothetical protein